MYRSEVWTAVRLFPLRIGPWVRFMLNRRWYRILDEDELCASKRSDTVFVLGSGASLNELSADDWSAIAEHDILGFNWSVHERFVRCDFHLIRGIPDSDLKAEIWRPQLQEYFSLIQTNAQFGETIFLVQSGFRAINGNRAIGYRYLPTRNPVFLWRSGVRVGPPSRSFTEGLVHGQSTIQECINFAYLLGWRRIVLAGVDLYDRRYFWLPANETRSVDEQRGAVAAEPHVQASMGLIETLDEWGRWLAGESVELSVLNPRSLLTAALPVYRFT